MITNSNFTPELKKSIEKDIALCEESILKPSQTHSVYNYMKAKYVPIYPNICDGIQRFAKTPSSDWVEELRMFKGALEGIVLNKTEPKQVEQQTMNSNLPKVKILKKRR